MNRLSKHNDGIEGEISKRRKINSLEEAKGMIGEYRKRKL